jgi:hypothetical protein
VKSADPFQANHERYEAWLDRHQAACISELLALRPFVPSYETSEERTPQPCGQFP